MSIADHDVAARATFIAVSYFAASAAATLTAIAALHVPLKIAGADLTTGLGQFLATVLVVGAIVVGGTTWVTTMLFDSTGVGGLEVPFREAATTLVPSLIHLVVPLPAGIILSRVFVPDVEAAWAILWLFTFSLLLMATALARHRAPRIRSLAPIGILDIAPPIYGVRLAWRDFYFDASRLPPSTVMIRAGAMTAATGAAASVVATAFAITIERSFGAVAVWPLLFIGFMAIVATMLSLKGPREHFRWLRPELRLTSRSYVVTILGLLARTPQSGDRDDLPATVRRWLHDKNLPAAVLPTVREVWYLEHLSLLVRLIRLVDADELLDQWRPQAEQALHAILQPDCGVAAWPGSHIASLAHTSHALALITNMEAQTRFPAARVAARVEALLVEHLTSGHQPRLSDIAGALQALDAGGWKIMENTANALPHLDPALSRTGKTPSLVDLCRIAQTANDRDGLDKLRITVLGRMWEILQRNPRREAAQLVDCCDAARALNLTRTTDSVVEIAEARMHELSADMAKQLRSVTGDPQNTNAGATHIEETGT